MLSFGRCSLTRTIKNIFVRSSKTYCTMESSDSGAFQPKFYTATGTPFSESDFYDKIAGFVNKIRPSAEKKGVLFVGENHQDTTAHAMELKILEKAFEVSRKENLNMAFSLEFYDREIQPVLDEYLYGFLDYDHFLEEIGLERAAGNDKVYKPLLEFCKQNRIPVIAANCPRRYSRLVARNGREILEKLPPSSLNYLAPLPYRKASDAYVNNFLEAMSVHDKTNTMSKMVDAQSLWDASMAYSIFQGLQKFDFVAHLSGYFHVKQNLGIHEHLLHYFCGEKRFLHCTVVIFPEEKPEFCDESHKNLADLLVLSDISKITMY